MQWFLNMKIGNRLMFSFGVVLFFMALVAASGLWGVIEGRNATVVMLDTDAQLAQNAARCRANILGMRRYEKDIFLNLSNKEKVAEYFKKRGWFKTEKLLRPQVEALRKMSK